MEVVNRSMVVTVVVVKVMMDVKSEFILALYWW